ncbi:MAG: glycine--tRNA ligase subunit beta, partial [Chloroflexi bacterium]
RVSRGPRFADAKAELAPGEFTTFTVEKADGYFKALQDTGVILDRDLRRRYTAKLVQEAAADAQGITSDDPELLDEVTDLVEAPQALLGSFEDKYLELPEPVLIGVMKKHQRYFPVFRDGKMLPHFITVANAADLDHPDVVVAGNEGVIRARYADAAFFYRRDTAQPLAEFTPRLATLTFHEKLGSMLDKVKRLEQLAPQIGRALDASEQQIAQVGRAAALAKSDLVTSMVVEMTSLQGIMGEIYALRSGEAPEVAQAIREHYLPRSAGDANPVTLPGLALSLADKLDSLIGLSAAGAVPTGSADPFGLRRAALGVVHNLLATHTDFSIRTGLEAAAALQPLTVPAQAVDETLAFVERRLQGVLSDLGFAHDVIEAVLAVRGDNPHAARRACEALNALVQQPWWTETFTAYARCARITRNLEQTLDLNPGAYVEAVEHELHTAWQSAAVVLTDSLEPAEELGTELRKLQDPINAYFDEVLVNAEDATLRHARLALVQQIATLPARVADLSKLQGF